MKKKYLISIICIILLSGWLAAGEAVVLPGHKEPTQVEVDPASEQLYVVEFPSVYIYSLEDFKLLKKIGEKGDGPGQFNRANDNAAGINIDVRPGEILVKSGSGKVALFKNTGKLIREKKLDPISILKFHGEKFAGVKMKEEKNIRHWKLRIYDTGFNEEREISSTPDWIQHIFGDIEMRLLNGSYPCVLSLDDKIFYCCGDWDFKVHVFDAAGAPLFLIRREYERPRFSEAYKKIVLDVLRSRFEGPIFDRVKRVLQFPAFFPAVRDIIGDGGTFYIRTFRKEEGKSEFFIYHTDGQFVRRVLLPIPPGSFKYSFPYMLDRSLFTIKAGKLYRLLKNEESKEYELHISAVDSY